MTMTALEALTKAAEICRKRAAKRFEELGHTEPDTNASYYGGANEDILESLDEEDEDCALAIEALRDSLPEREGMVLVPREPTQAMHNAAHAAETKVGWKARDRIYRAMLDASNLSRKEK